MITPIESSASLGLVEQFSQNPPLVGALWMVSSSLLTTYSTTRFLQHDAPDKQGKFLRVSRPNLLTLLRFGGSLCLGLLLPPTAPILPRIRSTLASIPHFALPALLLFIANVSNSISLHRIGISLTYTSKCAIPLLTAVWSVCLGEALPNLQALLCLLPIAVGIAAASWKAPSVEAVGLSAALLSATAQSLLNVVSKRAIAKTGLSGLAAQRAMVAVGLGIAGLWIMLQDDEPRRIPPAWLASAAVVAYHLEYALSFVFVSLVQPVTYGACDAVRRLSIILCGRAMFGGSPMTRTNRIGIAMALLGALGYSVSA